MMPEIDGPRERVTLPMVISVDAEIAVMPPMSLLTPLLEFINPGL